jgi:hypothetical protein
MKNKVMAFAFSAVEFAEEGMWEIEEKLGENHEFFTKGEWITNNTSNHPYEYWTSQEGCNAINKLHKKID